MEITASPAARKAKAAEKPGRVVFRHGLVVRLTHWLAALSILLLVMSGLGIFNAAPYLDASDKNNPARRVFEVGSDQDAAGHNIGFVKLFGLRVNTTHVLGVTDDGQGGEAERGFPGAVTMPGYQDLASSRRWHFFFAWVMVICGAAYFISGIVKRDLSLLILRPADLPKMLPMQLYYLKMRKEPPDHGKYNPLQKAGYTVLLFGLAPFLVLTGLALSPGVDSIAGPLTAVLGGRQFARLWHFAAMVAIIGFTFGHVMLVLTTGVFNNMRSMTIGTYRLGPHEGTGP